MGDDEKLDRSGAYDWDALVDEDAVVEVPDEFMNPPGVGRGDCDDVGGAEQDGSCDIELTAQVEDQVLEESKPGVGIPGFEGEEVGGG